MIKKVLKWVLVLVILLIIGSLFISNQYYIERSTMIKAPIQLVYDQVNILKNHEAWDPWKKMDSTLKLTYNEIPAGEGAAYDWDGEGKYSGKGRIVITKTEPNKLVAYSLDFGGKGGANAGHKLEQVGDSVKVIWYLEDDLGWNPMNKYMWKIMGGFLGEVFDNGLKDLKQVCESMPATPASAYKIEQIEMKDTMPYLCIRTKATGETISGELGKCYGMIMEAMKKQGLNFSSTGKPFATYYAWENNNFEFDAGIPTDKAGKEDGSIKAGEVAAGNYLFTSYFGNYEGTGAAHMAVQDYAKSNNLKIKMAATEVYVTDPMTEKDTAKWQTDIYYFIEQ